VGKQINETKVRVQAELDAALAAWPKPGSWRPSLGRPSM
jgi:hypothetical protein